MYHSYDVKLLQTTRRRRKLTTSVLFPQVLDAQAILKCGSGNGNYRLTTVLLHNGTALGGHYRSYTKNYQSETAWKECNDASVHSLSSQDEQSLFWYNSDVSVDATGLWTPIRFAA
jgi:ubiquitin C-terminal hydrolase